MTKPNENAFPFQDNGTDNSVDWGMTKLEYLAAMAMQGLISTQSENNYFTDQQIAESAVNYAKALIEALNK